jgi:hypothetical protein
MGLDIGDKVKILTRQNKGAIQNHSLAKQGRSTPS